MHNVWSHHQRKIQTNNQASGKGSEITSQTLFPDKRCGDIALPTKITFEFSHRFPHRTNKMKICEFLIFTCSFFGKNREQFLHFTLLNGLVNEILCKFIWYKQLAALETFNSNFAKNKYGRVGQLRGYWTKQNYFWYGFYKRLLQVNSSIVTLFFTFLKINTFWEFSYILVINILFIIYAWSDILKIRWTFFFKPFVLYEV